MTGSSVNLAEAFSPASSEINCGFWSLSASLGNLTSMRTLGNPSLWNAWLPLRLQVMMKCYCKFIQNDQHNERMLLFSEAFVLQQMNQIAGLLVSFESTASELWAPEADHNVNTSSPGNRTKPLKCSFRWMGNAHVISSPLQFSHLIAWPLPALSNLSAFTVRSWIYNKGDMKKSTILPVLAVFTPRPMSIMYENKPACVEQDVTISLGLWTLKYEKAATALIWTASHSWLTDGSWAGIRTGI